MNDTVNDTVANKENQRADLEQMAALLAAAGVAVDPAELSEEAQALITRAKEDVKKVQQQAQKGIADHPLASVGVIFLAGVVLGSLLGRR